MEVLWVPGTFRNVLNHHQVCFCEGSILQQSTQLHLSFEIDRFYYSDLLREALFTSESVKLGHVRACVRPSVSPDNN